MQGTSGSIADQVKNSLNIPEGGDALDFIKSNLKSVSVKDDTVEKIVTGEPIVEVSKTAILESAPKEEPKIENPPIEPSPDPAPKLETPPKLTAQDLIDDKEDEKSWKGLRNKATRWENKAEENAKLLLEKEEYIAKIEKGEIEIEPIKALKEEKKSLEKFKYLFEFESAPETIETFVEPLNKVKEKLKLYSEEYKVPLEELEALIDKDGVAETNKFLGTRFDPIGGAEVKGLIDNAKALKRNFESAKQNSKESLEALRSNAILAKQNQEIERVGRIDSKAKTSWVRAVQKLQADEKYPELTYRQDPEHDSFVKGVLDNTAKEYGIFIQFLADHGVKDLPEEIGEILASRFLLSETAGVMAQSRDVIFKEHMSTLNGARDRRKYDNPPLGSTFRGSSNGGGPNVARGPDSPVAAGDAILRKIGL